jgi:hypothetical protein
MNTLHMGRVSRESASVWAAGRMRPRHSHRSPAVRDCFAFQGASPAGRAPFPGIAQPAFLLCSSPSSAIRGGCASPSNGRGSFLRGT